MGCRDAALGRSYKDEARIIIIVVAVVVVVVSVVEAAVAPFEAEHFRARGGVLQMAETERPRGCCSHSHTDANDNDLWVFKLPERALHGQLRGVER